MRSFVAPSALRGPSAEARAIALAARRQFHSDPEVSFDEHRTSAYIARQLSSLGVTYRNGLAGTGVLAVIDTGRPGPVSAFRADLDALPITEESDVAFRSINHGIMHACGHDMHAGILLGLVAELKSRIDEFDGTLVFVFQPGEEANGGAQRMIDDGALDAPKVEQIFGLHVVPHLPTGRIALRAGALTATDDEFHIEIMGKDAHSSEPELGINALSIAAQIVVALPQLTATLDPFSVATLTPASLHCGEAVNVIPATAHLHGMMRCTDIADKLALREKLRTLARNVARAYGGEAEVRISEGFPPVVNDAHLTQLVATVASAALATPDHVVSLPRPHLGSEDFAYYQQAIPGVMFMLGCAEQTERERPAPGGLHTSTFRPDEEALSVGIKIFTAIALSTNGREEALKSS